MAAIPKSKSTGFEDRNRNPRPVTDVEIQFDPPDFIAGPHSDVDAASKRRDVGYTIRNMVKADEEAKGALWESYDRTDQAYLGRDTEAFETPWEDAPTFNQQTMRNKLDGITAFTCLPLVKADPYFLFKSGGMNGNPNEQIEYWVSFFLTRSQWPLMLAEATNLVERRSKCPVKLEYQAMRRVRNKTEKPSLKIEPLDTQYFRIYPNTAVDFKKARLVGDIIQVSVDWITEHKKSGWFFDDIQIIAGQPDLLTMADKKDDKQADASNAKYVQDVAVDLFVGLYAEDFEGEGEDTWYEVVVSINDGMLLFMEEYKSDAELYHDFFFWRETGRYYNEASIATLLYDTHNSVNFDTDMMRWTTLYDSMPPVAGMGFGLPDEDIQLRPGTFIPMEEGGSVQQLGGHLNTNLFGPLIEMGKRNADETARISQNGTAGNLSPGTTATEAAQVAQGQATGIEAYQYLGLAFGMVRLARSVQILLGENFDDWYPEYQNQGPQVTKEDFLADYWIMVNGQTPTDTPQAIAGQATQLLQAWNIAVQGNPDLAMRYPDLVPELIRSLVESSTLPSKHKIMPSREEDAANQQAIQQQKMQQQQQLRSQFAAQLAQQLGQQQQAPGAPGTGAGIASQQPGQANPGGPGGIPAGPNPPAAATGPLQVPQP